jgi:hypothetical protein
MVKFYGVSIMKTRFITLFLFLALVSFGPTALGQNISTKNPSSRQALHAFYKKSLPAGFMSGLQIQQLTNHRINNKSSQVFAYRIDTAVIYSNNANPQRQINVYDSAANQLASYMQLLNNETWEYSSMDTSVFDSVGNRLVLINRTWADGQWQNASEQRNTYTDNGKVLSSVNMFWADDHWENSDSTSFAYNANGNKVASFHAEWSDTTSAWLSSSFHLYTYDSVGNLTLSLGEVWGDSTWTNTQQIIYTYDSVSNLKEGLVQTWKDTSWVNFYKETYTYDDFKNKLSYTGEIWNDTVWMNDQHYDYTYDAEGRLISGVGKNWNGTTWINFDKGQFTYDTYGGIETYLYQEWENDTAWQNVSLSQYAYDSAGNAYEGNYYSWDTTGNDWSQNNDGILQIYYNYSTSVAYFTGYHVVVSYNAPLSTGVKNRKKEIVSRYNLSPNPAINYTAVSVELQSPEEISLDIYNLTGKKVATVFSGRLGEGAHRFTVPVTQFPSGLYFVSLLTATNQQVKTMKLVVRN